MKQKSLIRTLVLVFGFILLCSFVFAITSPEDGYVYYNWTNLTDQWNSILATNSGASSSSSFPSFGVSGNSGTNSFSCDGSSNYLTSPNSAEYNSASFSGSVWINASNKDDGRFLSKERDGSSGYSYYTLMFSDGGDIRFLKHNTVTSPFYAIIPAADWSINTWYNIVFTYNATSNNMQIFLDGISKDNTTLTGTENSPSTDPLQICRFDSDHGLYWEGLIDEIKFFNRTLNQTEITQIAEYGKINISVPPSGTTSDPVFVDPTPANGTHNNSQVVINITCSDGSVYLWFNGSKVIDNVSSPASYITNMSVSGSYVYDAACFNSSLSGFSNNVSRTWVYDIVYPAITFNVKNAFDVDNFSQVSQYIDEMVLNITFTDNIDLFAYSVNVTKNGGLIILYNESNSSISGTTFNYSKVLNTSSWLYGVYDIEIKVADSHTVDKIPDYKVTNKKSSITFKTEDDNNIKIETDDSSDISATKFEDRYSFEIEFDDGLSKGRSFHVKSDKCPLVYREDSDYAAHFVSFCDFSGNWIDFEGLDSDYTIFKMDDYHYIVNFDSVPSNIVFNSIGGLNILTTTHTWYKGTATKTADPAGINESSEILLSLTRHSSQDNFSAFLIYNGTTYTSPTKIDDGSTVDWNQTIFSSLYEGEIPYYWNITYNQTDGSIINFVLNGTQTVFDWGVFNCTGGNVSLILNILDENYPTTTRVATVDIEILTWVTNPNNFHTFEAKLESNSTYSICLYPANESLLMDFYAQYTTLTGFTHRYYLYNYSISNTSQNISMYNTNFTTGYSELVVTARRTENYRYFENVVAKLQRRYVDEGVWRSIQMDQSGDFGTIIFHIWEQTTDYKILYYDTSNNLLKETETLKFSCTDNKCELTQLLDEVEAAAIGENITVYYSLNNLTNVLTINWFDPEANNNKVEVRVSKQTLTGELIICDVFQTGSAGTVNCNVSGYTGDIFLTVLTSQSPYTPIISTWINLARLGLYNYMSVQEQSFWTAGIMITTIGFGLWSSVAALIAAIFGLILVFFLGIFKPITMTFIIIAGAMGIAASLKIKK